MKPRSNLPINLTANKLRALVASYLLRYASWRLA